jgi:hypothetical protein
MKHFVVQLLVVPHDILEIEANRMLDCGPCQCTMIAVLVVGYAVQQFCGLLSNATHALLVANDVGEVWQNHSVD